MSTSVLFAGSDPDYANLFENRATTSKLGVAATKWTVPEFDPPAFVRVEVDHLGDDGRTSIAYRTLDITTEPAPRFEVEIGGDRVFFPDKKGRLVWPEGGLAELSFRFEPTMAIEARSAPSTLWDYYAPESRIVLPPMDFRLSPERP